nr:hypothetical protein 90 [bacterium]
MTKSVYPSELDTSKELPPVRDNITEIGSEIINSLRSAIFNIEKTLGVNPQGATGNTVASRVNTALDESGNIRKSALTLANVLSGPITDAEVSNVAAIAESKLRLTFPTQVLQDQISILNGEFSTIADQIESLNSTVSAHVNPSATNRHTAGAITVEAASAASSSTAFTSLESDNTLQAVWEALINGHINFSGTVSSTNNSHDASQIHFDNSEVEDVIFQENLQGAMEDLALLESVGIRNTTLNIASNGRVRTGSVNDDYEALDLSDVVLESAEVSFIREGSRTRFLFSEVQTPLEEVALFDYLNLSNSDTEDDNKSYQIAEIINSGDDISGVIVFGTPLGDSILGLTATISRNPYVTYNPNGLNSVARPRADKTNTPDVCIANPNAATILAEGIEPSKIESGANAFDILIDGGSAITIETYDSNVSEQTLDSIVNKINEQAVDQNLNFLAYKLKNGSCYTLALTHTLPNMLGDVTNRTLEIQAGSSNDGTTELGFGDLLEQQVEGSGGNTYHINGRLLDTFGKIIQLTSDSIQIVSTTNTLSLISNTFEELGVRVSDWLVITGSEDSDDDGTYRISDVSGATATLDSASLELTGDLSSTGAVHIVRASASVHELDFTEAVSSTGSILFDVFVTEEQDVHYHKRMEIEQDLSSGGFTAALVDVSRNFITAEESAIIVIGTDGLAYLTDPSSQDGPSVYVGQSGTYRLLASDGLSYVTIAVNGSGLPASTLAVTIYGFNEINSGNYRTCRGTFVTSLGRVLGEYAGVGVPSVLDKRRSGTVDETIISESLLEKYIEGPRNELRANGVVRGLRVSNVVLIDSGEVDEFGSPIYYHEADIDAGIVYVNGIRYEIAGFSAYRFNIDSDFYIGIDANGCVVHGEQITNPDGYTDGYTDQVSSLADQEIAYLAFIDASTTTATDLRFFIDRLDLKSGKIVVSKSQNFGHFTEISSAVAYASRFTELHPDQGTPTIYIDQGDYEISETIVVDFDVKICGAGPDTVLQRTGSFATGTTPSSGNIDFGDAVFLVGTTSEEGASRIENGVTFSDFSYHVSEDIEAVCCMISITHPLVKSGGNAGRFATYRVQNVNFIGNENINYGTGADDELVGEYAIAVGQSDESTFTPVSSITMGNLIVTGCRFDRMGVEVGAIVFSNSASGEFRNVIVTGNIGSFLSPNKGDVGFDIIEYPGVPSFDQIVEANNART